MKPAQSTSPNSGGGEPNFPLSQDGGRGERVTCLLAVFAHPDDEGMASGTLSKAASNGVHVVLTCATRGEVGEISHPALAAPENLGDVREAELRAACDVLGIKDLRLLGYRDSGMAGTPANDDPRCYHQANPEAATRQLVHLIRDVRPQVVVTHEPGGGYGHPDHIAVSRYTTAAFDLAGDPGAFPEAGQPWRPRRLYYAVLPRSMFKQMRRRMEALGLDAASLDQFIVFEPGGIEEQVTHVVDVSTRVEAKRAAFNCHETQFGTAHPLRQLPEEVMRGVFSREYFIQARPAPAGSPDPPR
ncbi:MAG: PIG-L family deacetylase [Anaerolineae bacterium]